MYKPIIYNTSTYVACDCWSSKLLESTWEGSQVKSQTERDLTTLVSV